MRVIVNNDFSAITLSSLDSELISNVAQLLLAAGAKAENAGHAWNSDRTGIADLGTKPSLIEVVYYF